MRYLLLALLLMCPAFSYAVSVRGYVRTAEGKPVDGANVLLFRSSDSSLVKIAVAASQGQYSFDLADTGNYFLKATSAGYAPSFTAPFTCRSAEIVLPEIVLSTNQKTLGEVTVKAQKPLLEVHADKIVMNVENSIAAAGSTAFEVLQRAPGVNVDQNDNVSLKGRQAVNIMLDGKLIPISGADLANMLKGMPSGSIEKVEIISNPGARYDAAGSAGIINIRTKKDKRIGANGSLTAGYTQGNYPKANIGLGLNYRNKKLVLFSNYNYAYRAGVNNLELFRKFYDSGMLSAVYRQTNTMNLPFRTHFATIGADYSLDNKTTVGAVFTGSLNRFDISSRSDALITDAHDVAQSSFMTTRDAKNFGDNLGINLNLRRKVDTAGSELTADLDYARYNNSSDQYLHTYYYKPDGSKGVPDYMLYGEMKGYTDIRSLKADYSKPFKSGMRLEAGIKSSLVHADNDPAFFDQSSGANRYDSGKSNHFIYDENINAAYLNTARDWRKWSVQTGLRVEQTIAKGHQVINDERFDRNYAKLFPSLAIVRHVDAKNDIGITLSRRIDRPAYQQLNPFRRYLDQTSVSQGNPYLNPALTWNIELSHTWGGRFMTQLTYSRTSDAIINVIQPEQGQMTVVTDKNLATNTSYLLSGNYPLKPFKWWSSVNNLVLYYNYFEGDLANTPLATGRMAFQLTSQNSFTLSKSWTSELSFHYQSPERYGYMQLRPNYVLSGGIQKSFGEGLITVKLAFTDALLLQNPRGSSEFSNYYEDFVVIRDTRTATLQATYRFGKKNVAPVRRHQRGAEEELRRAQAGAS